MAIVQNQNIAKYIYYNKSNDPLSMPEVTADLLGEGYCHLNFFDEKVVEDEKVRLFLNVLGSPLKKPADNVTFLLEIVCPPQSYVLHGRGEFRSIRVLDEVAQLIDQQLGIGAGEVEMVHYRESKDSKSGYNVTSVNIIVKNPTIKGHRQ